mmetsp:Transcript_66130/g.191584  ORF Transcript_66130/g.191584 Transcript_66130/m.191584 type:complete len:212 (+) Transcript_66130:1233-1868(+)
MRPQVLDHPGGELVRAAILVLRHLGCLRVPELTTSATTPTVQQAFSRQGHRVRIAARDLHDARVLQAAHEQRHGLVRIALDVLGHVLGVAVAQLPTGAGTPTVELAMDGDRSGVPISARDLADLYPGEGLDKAGDRLVRIAVLVLGQVLEQGESQLAHLTAAPGVHVSARHRRLPSGHLLPAVRRGVALPPPSKGVWAPGPRTLDEGAGAA